MNENRAVLCFHWRLSLFRFVNVSSDLMKKEFDFLHVDLSLAVGHWPGVCLLLLNVSLHVDRLRRKTDAGSVEMFVMM